MVCFYLWTPCRLQSCSLSLQLVHGNSKFLYNINNDNNNDNDNKTSNENMIKYNAVTMPNIHYIVYLTSIKKMNFQTMIKYSNALIRSNVRNTGLH